MCERIRIHGCDGNRTTFRIRQLRQFDGIWTAAASEPDASHDWRTDGAARLRFSSPPEDEQFNPAARPDEYERVGVVRAEFQGLVQRGSVTVFLLKHLQRSTKFKANRPNIPDHGASLKNSRPWCQFRSSRKIPDHGASSIPDHGASSIPDHGASSGSVQVQLLDPVFKCRKNSWIISKIFYKIFYNNIYLFYLNHFISS